MGFRDLGSTMTLARFGPCSFGVRPRVLGQWHMDVGYRGYSMVKCSLLEV